MVSRDIISRRNQLLRYVAAKPRFKSDIIRHLAVSERTLQNDMKWLDERFPDRLKRPRHDNNCVMLSWPGPVPHLLRYTIDHLAHEELIALVAARGLLRDPAAAGYTGPLDGALHCLLQRLGAEEQAHNIDPTAIQIDRFAAISEPATYLSTAITAVLEKHYLDGIYSNRLGETHRVHLIPLRLLLIDGEFHLLAWCDPQHPVNNYRLARFQSLDLCYLRPPQAPSHVDPTLIERHRAAAFRTHGDHRPQARQRVSLQLGPQAIPHVCDRRWGLDQTWDPNPHDLPTGWARLCFTTSGLPACLHWVLSLGAQAVIETPDVFREHLMKELRTMARHYRRKQQPR